MPASLFDAADLVRLRAAVDRAPSPTLALLACLLDGGVLRHRGADSRRTDGDRVIVGVPTVAARVGAALSGGWQAVGPGDALAVAYGTAAAHALDRGAGRVWCLLDAAACDDGGTWEAALAAAAASVPLVALVGADTGADRLARVFAATGWAVAAPAREAVALLGGLDQSLAAGGPAAVVVA